MGFSSGPPAADAIWRRLKKAGLLPKSSVKQQEMAAIIVEEFESLDSDDWDMDPGSVYATARPDEVEEFEGDESEDGYWNDDEDDVDNEDEEDV